MSKKKQNTNVQTDTLTEKGRALWLAGLGTIATLDEERARLADTLDERRKQLEADSRKRIDELQKEASKLFDQLVARGKNVEAEGRKRLDAQASTLKREARETREDLEARGEEIAEKVETILERLELPTRNEVKGLAAKVSTLTERVAKLAEMLDDSETVVFHVVPAEEGWAIKGEGDDEPVLTTDKKSEALEKARTLAEAAAPSRLVVHRQDGTIMNQTSYPA